ncbi:uncharacterized protein LACBIDRAFT_295326 [Laccaria bicolor S238N-H82]|uniref:Oxidation resistance protein 1 n=1 Tax=Laccaria bicolor (strain S238N-H82 / ATCC MYA-4686) TaxID=486041 RepID=B0DQJ3_LACBS|nr:uncharacterized protein LACBIDRAFT_295326 [Laccaria bicolor S238N-H82]EDR03123.1 predicted protein [Laccaria bicolor S238N-H82]|eukprot:XP_001886264.1 predicted protein [Laccaria bicolor S238N-H82]
MTTTTQETEQNMDKFSTLFSPSTPRASPILGTTTLPNPSQPSSSSVPSFYHRHHAKQASSDSDFGAFVSVGPAEDPLLADFEFNDKHPVLKPTTFFDKFAQDAKRKVEEKRRSVLDELLMHEDDPMYWLKDERTVSVEEERREPNATTDEQPNGLLDQQPLSPLLQDLDLEFFKKSTSRPSLNPSSSPTRSPTAPVLAPPTLAPFIASKPIIINNIDYPISSSPPPDPGHAERPHTTSPPPGRSTSYSSRWMSSILRSHPASSGGTPLPGARSSLEGVYSAGASHPPSHSHFHPQQSHSEPTQPHHPIAPTPIQITHTTPFAPSSTNPFATHVFRPISGAPGFTGEDRYERWDKGYSRDLERELVGRGRRDGDGEREHLEFGWDGESAVKLVGRKEGTQEVLSGGVAEMIRTHLPALARLPRTWTLLYSLDQHGISLNTLYANCERNGRENNKDKGGRSAGELVVVRDEGGMTFGVWLGEEGVRNGRGRGYYGSGESFLWKFDGEKLEVFKWTGKNDYVALCEPEFISFGGGDGHYGLYLDENLTDGSSAACPTFGNPPLCSLGPRKAAGSVDFECVGLEVWGCGP